MLITLYGPDSYRRIQKLNKITNAYKEKYTGFSYDRFDMEIDTEFDRFKNFVGSQSMFDKVKLAIIDNILESPQKKDIKTLLKAQEEDKNITIIINESKKPPAMFKFLLEKQNQTQEFPALKNGAVKDFIQKKAEENRLQIDMSVISFLIDTYGGNTWGITTELESMALATNKVVNTKRSTDFFQLINTLKGGYNAKQRLFALESLISDRGDDSAKIFNMIATRPRSAQDAKKFADYDIAVKSGKLEYEEVLLSLALGF